MNIALAMLNILIDPKASVDRFAGKKFAWVAPVLLMGVVSAVISWLTVPIVIRIMMLNPPEGVQPDQLEQSIGMIAMFQKVASVFSPVVIAVMLLLSAAVLLATCSIMDIKATLGDLYNLVAFCSLVSFVQAVATGVVVYQQRDDIHNFAELQPAFGLNLLLPEGSNRVLDGFLGYFSIFTIWYIVILALAFAYLVKVPRGKAFAATAPVWLVGLVFALIGSLFRPA